MQRETVPCKFCTEPTPMLGTQMCDPCWELHRRLGDVKAEILTKIIADLNRSNHTDADVLRAWHRDTQGHHNNCGCGACCFDPRGLDIPPFADCPGDSPSVATHEVILR